MSCHLTASESPSFAAAASAPQADDGPHPSRSDHSLALRWHRKQPPPTMTSASTASSGRLTVYPSPTPAAQKSFITMSRPRTPAKKSSTASPNTSPGKSMRIKLADAKPVPIAKPGEYGGLAWLDKSHLIFDRPISRLQKLFHLSRRRLQRHHKIHPRNPRRKILEHPRLGRSRCATLALSQRQMDRFPQR